MDRIQILENTKDRDRTNISGPDTQALHAFGSFGYLRR